MNDYRRWVLASTLLLLGAIGGSQPLAAQQSRLSPGEIRQIVHEALRVVLPPDKSVSGVPVAQRGIRFDYALTLAAFGSAETPTAAMFDSLPVRASAGSESLLADCGYRGSGACELLGWSVYVSVRPGTVTDSQAVVWANLVWPARGATEFEAGTAPTGRAILVGYSQELILTPTTGGRWQFERIGQTLVSE